MGQIKNIKLHIVTDIKGKYSRLVSYHLLSRVHFWCVVTVSSVALTCGRYKEGLVLRSTSSVQHRKLNNCLVMASPMQGKENLAILSPLKLSPAPNVHQSPHGLAFDVLIKPPSAKSFNSPLLSFNHV